MRQIALSCMLMISTIWRPTRSRLASFWVNCRCLLFSATSWDSVIYTQASDILHFFAIFTEYFSALWPIFCSRVLYIEPVLIISDIRLIQDYCGFGTCMLGQKNDIRLHFLNYNCGGAPTNQTIEVFIEDKAKEWSNRDLTLPAAFGTFVGHPGVKQVCPCDPLITYNILWPTYYLQYVLYWINISSGELLQSSSCSDNHIHNHYQTSRS